MEHENKWDGEEIAGRVRSVVSDVMESLEIGHWNQVVRDRLDGVLEEAGRQMAQRRARAEDARWRRQAVEGDGEDARWRGQAVGGDGEDTRWRGQAVGGNGEAATPRPKSLEVRVNWKGRVSGILFTVFGSIGSAAFGLPALGVLAAMSASVYTPLGWWIAGGCGAAALGFFGMLWTGISQNRRIGRLKRYVAELKSRGKSYCELEELGRSCARSTGFVRKDLRKMIGLGMLPDVKMDRKGSWLLLDDETYRQFQLFEKAQARQAQERPGRMSLKDRLKGWGKGQRQERQDTVEDRRDIREKEREEDGARGADTPLEAAVRQGEAYIAALRRLRESMPGDPVDARLARLETVLGHLFGTLKKHPEQMDEMERFMEYYLPTTVKLAESYREFAGVEFPGENVRQAKGEILKTLDTINEAFERLQDDLYQDAALDVMTDASVLQTMLARDGMGGADFQKTTQKS